MKKRKIMVEETPGTLPEFLKSAPVTLGSATLSGRHGPSVIQVSFTCSTEALDVALRDLKAAVLAHAEKLDRVPRAWEFNVRVPLVGLFA